MSEVALVAFATGGLSLVFAVAFIVACRIDNYGIVDVVWSYAFAAVAVLYSVGADGAGWRRAVLCALVATWSIRLGTHLGLRVWRHHPAEDARYRQLRHDWRSSFTLRMFGFFQLQAVSVVLLATPFLLAARNTAPRFHAVEAAAFALWLGAMIGESIADAQLAAFKRGSGHAGRVCDLGLWRYSRHPNYFFEWLVWVAFALFAAPAPFGALGFVAPAAMLYLLLRVTGIPLTEAQSVRSKGDAYRAYQRRTSGFVPWFPRLAEKECHSGGENPPAGPAS